MLHLLAANYDWHHHITPTSEDIRVFATIFPMVRINLVYTNTVQSANKNSRTTFSSASAGAMSMRPRDINREKVFCTFFYHKVASSIAYPDYSSGCNLIFFTLITSTI